MGTSDKEDETHYIEANVGNFLSLLRSIASSNDDDLSAKLSTSRDAFSILDNLNSPNACQPVRDERERGHEQDEDSRAVLWVAVNLPGHPDETQQTRRF